MDSATYLATPYQHGNFSDPVGLGIEYNGFEQYALQATATPHRSNTASPYMTNGTPPTPQNGDVIRTRSGRPIRHAATPALATPRSTPPSTKRQREKKMKPRHLAAPLSELTKDMKVPVRDMQAWVNRPIEERLEEAKKRKGYITRPMNSFMLYRSAYAERTKAWCAENNHQIVSSVSGESWPMEPEEVRDFYNELAKIERLNHQNAHPDYKFSPAKPGFAGRKRKGTDESDVEFVTFSDGDPDAEWGPPPKRSKARRAAGDATYTSRRAAAPVMTQETYEFDPYGNPIVWHAGEFTRPAPQPIVNQHPYGVQCYQQPVQHPYAMQAQAHEQDPYGTNTIYEYEDAQPLMGLPMQSHYDLPIHSSGPSQLPYTTEQHVDPLLGPYDALDHCLAAYPHEMPPPPVEVDYTSSMPAVHGEPTVSQDYAPYNPEMFHPETIEPVFAQHDEFDRYWDEAPVPESPSVRARQNQLGE